MTHQDLFFVFRKSLNFKGATGISGIYTVPQSQNVANDKWTFHWDTKIKRSHTAKKGYLFQHACLQTFTEPWGENELQIKMSIWCIILIGTDGKRELYGALILQPEGTDLGSCHYQLSRSRWACWEVDSERMSAVLTGVCAGKFIKQSQNKLSYLYMGNMIDPVKKLHNYTISP